MSIEEEWAESMREDEWTESEWNQLTGVQQAEVLLRNLATPEELRDVEERISAQEEAWSVLGPAAEAFDRERRARNGELMAILYRDHIRPYLRNGVALDDQLPTLPLTDLERAEVEALLAGRGIEELFD